MKIAFFNPKGGVGKTTCATQSAVVMVANGFKVAFIDMDKQHSATHYLESINPKFKPAYILHSVDDEIPADTNIIVIDSPANYDFTPDKDFLLVSPTGSTKIDLHAYRRVLELENDGYRLIKVINGYNPIRKDDKSLLMQFENCVVITANSAIRNSMSRDKTIWNSGEPGGRKAKRQFTHLLNCISKGYAPFIMPEEVNKIASIDGYSDMLFEREQQGKLI
jgi:hypothetical protein